MLKLLIKQQLIRFFAAYTIDPKTGKRRKKSAMIPYCLLLVYIVGIFAFNSVTIAVQLCSPLVEANAQWYYFIFMGLFAFSFATLMSALSSYTSLYQSTDNELLLSLPIKPYTILLSRLVPMFIFGAAFVMMFLVPAYVVYEIETGFSLVTTLLAIVMVVLVSFLAFAVSGLLGFLIAQVTARIKRKNAGTIILALLFGFGYAVFYSYVSSTMQQTIAKAILMNETNGRSILVILGNAFFEPGIGLLLFIVLTAILSFVVYLLLEKSFLKMLTFKKGFKKAKFKKEMIKAKSFRKALLRHEFIHLGKSANYLLNVSLGSFMAILGGVLILVLGWKITSLLELISDYKPFFAPVVAAVSILAACMNDMTSISVSIEGKNMWILRSLPVSTMQILNAKINTHCILTCIPAMFLALSLSIVARLNVFPAILCILIAGVYGFLTAVEGLRIDLKHPKMTYLSEMAAVKQNTNVLIAIGLDFSVLVILAGLFVLGRRVFNPTLYLLGCLVVMVVTALLIYRWIKNKGTKLLENL